MAEQLDQRKARRVERLAAARERQRRIDDAEKTFTDAWATIEIAKEDLDGELAALEKRAEQARAKIAEKIGENERMQAAAAAAIRAEGCKVDEIAAILQIAPARVRSLLAEDRRLHGEAATGVADGGGDDSPVAVESNPPGSETVLVVVDEGSEVDDAGEDGARWQSAGSGEVAATAEFSAFGSAAFGQH
ncbi:hypothetical protein ACIHDR_46780 [Nocardia sp. NPDC052278]|uniref:hypothetical protein n=1 Tax=unclassified Nocardia TaxID=2637762 RepID=UPI00368F88A4